MKRIAQHILSDEDFKKLKPQNKKIHCEELSERANKWFDSLGCEAEDMIVNAYMLKFGIKDEDVDW